MTHPKFKTRRRLWPVFVAPALFLALAVGWSVFWYIAATKAEARLDQWQAREAKAGRVYSCDKRSFGGYPFRLELRCSGAGLTLASAKPPMRARLGDLAVVAQVYTPSLLIAEFSGPLALNEDSGAQLLTAHWSLAQTSVRGLPQDPQRVSIAIDNPVIDRLRGVGGSPVVEARHAELHGRLVGGSVRAEPVIELSASIENARAPALHALTAQPFDAEAVALLRGLKDFSPKPWRARFREIAAAGGNIEVMRSRIQQGEFLAVGAGRLSINAQGRLDGELRMTMAGIEKILPALGIDKMLQNGVSQENLDRIAPGVKAADVNQAIGALDRLIPGLGRAVSRNANTSIVAGLSFLGQPAELEGRRALAVPLRFKDGSIFLGPVKVGQAPALF